MLRNEFKVADFFIVKIIEEKARRRRERIDAAWAIELEKGNASYQKMQDLLKKYAEKKEKY